MTELLPYPFCGALPRSTGRFSYWSIHCANDECGVHVETTGATLDDSSQLWNTRSAPSVDAAGWTCKALRSTFPEQVDCDWPNCGCDPAASKVIEALQEQGMLRESTAAPSATGKRIALKVRDLVWMAGASGTYFTARTGFGVDYYVSMHNDGNRYLAMYGGDAIGRFISPAEGRAACQRDFEKRSRFMDCPAAEQAEPKTAAAKR